MIYLHQVNYIKIIPYNIFIFKEFCTENKCHIKIVTYKQIFIFCLRFYNIQNKIKFYNIQNKDCISKSKYLWTILLKKIFKIYRNVYI